MCYFKCPSTKKISVSRSFNRISNSWYNPRWRSLLVTRWVSTSATTRKMYLLLTEKIKDFPLKKKIFSKPLRRVLQPPSTPPCTALGVWICVYVRGLNCNAFTKRYQVFWENPLLSTTQPNLATKRPNTVKNSAKYDSGALNENIVQNNLNIALLNIF